jgi:beta-glucosidase/6-phospho-beta-glucosidase/beta-galactosidase
MRLFNSFFIGGFECSDHINRSGERINLLKETEHDVRVEEDYQLLKNNGILTVREGACWSIIEPRPFKYDFSSIKDRIAAADKYGITQVWDICHFGYPDDLIPTHPNFVFRFAEMCRAFVKFFRDHSDQTLFVVPINEISFLAWHSGEVRGTVPFAVNSGFDIKYHLCKAAIAGINALRSEDPNCRIVTVEPLIHIHPPVEDYNEKQIFDLNEYQFQAMDILAGRLCPELGGKEENLDLLGFNYYFNNQWRHNEPPLPWPEIIPARKPLHQLLEQVYDRYTKPVILSETGHFGVGRSAWLEEITSECITALRNGVDLTGICIYPVTDRPDWDNLNNYFNCGLWDLDNQKNRIPHLEYLHTVKRCNEAVAEVLQEFRMEQTVSW